MNLFMYGLCWIATTFYMAKSLVYFSHDNIRMTALTVLFAAGCYSLAQVFRERYHKAKGDKKCS